MFEEFFKQHNVPLPPKPIAPNQFTRWGKNNRYSAIRLGDDGIYFEDFSSGIKETWFPKGEPLTPEEVAIRKHKAVKARCKAEIERKQQHERAAETVRQLWNSLPDGQGGEHDVK